jgi:hypothetical protein
MERTMGFEPTTFCLASRRSTTELRPLQYLYASWVSKLLKMCLNPITNAQRNTAR